jgi:hypothetical protein
MAPAPKAPGARVRRNTNQPQWKHLAAARPATPPPAPEHWSDWRKEWWRAIWRSPMAVLWIESDVFNLLDLGEIMELPKKSAEHYGEIRQKLSHYGLTPASRKTLFWDVPIEGETVEEKKDDDNDDNVRRLRAV